MAIGTEPGAIVQEMFDRALAAMDYRVKPVSGAVRAVNTRNNLMDVETGSSGDPRVGVPHPFQSPNSWIRAYPEPGATVLLHERAESPHMVTLGYYRDAEGAVGEGTNDPNLPFGRYRAMLPGEIDVASSGMAEAYFDVRGNVELRSKLITQTLNWDKLEIKGRAPTHVRQIEGNIASPSVPVTLGDEDRFGLIKRAFTHPQFEKYILTVPYSYGPAPSFGKEYIRIINAKPAPGVPASPLKVIDYREGTTVINDQGLPELVGASSVPGPLRFDGKYFVVPGTDAFRVSMNLLGQVGVQLPLLSTRPDALSVQIPAGGAKFQLGQSFTINAGTGITVGAVATVNVTSGQGVTIEGPQVKLGSGAVSAITKAEELTAALDTAISAAIAIALPLAGSTADGGSAAFTAFGKAWDTAKASIKAIKAKAE